MKYVCDYRLSKSVYTSALEGDQWTWRSGRSVLKEKFLICI